MDERAQTVLRPIAPCARSRRILVNVKTQLAVALLAACSALSLAGCATEYIIATTDGRMITTNEKPELDDETGMLHYEDEAGRDQQIKQDDVKQMIER
ncbi:MAG: YgdI/YgdR family lipoprotein [Haliea sp.]|nr:YgdI/YgdR family lipoprotein [Haliea sp.]